MEARDVPSAVMPPDNGTQRLHRAAERPEQQDDDATLTRSYTPPAKWGPLPAIVLLPCLLFGSLGGAV